MIQIPSKTFQGVSLPVYGLGTWGMGGKHETDDSQDQVYIKAIQDAVENGITHIDTAEVYGDGHTEELVGEAIKDFDRSKLFITTKVAEWNQSYSDVKESCEKSLKRLGQDYIDLYLLHRYPVSGIPISETMRALDELVEEGKVRQIGVSNFTVKMLEEVKKHAKHPIVCNQVHYSLACREIVDKGILEYCRSNDIAIIAWGPLEKGMLSDEVVLGKIAQKYNKTPYQVALNWLINQNGVVTIPKTTSLEHLKENLGALGWQLNENDMDVLTNDFPGQYFVSDRLPLTYKTDLDK